MTIGHRRLILTRHAKSSWDDPGMDDHDRPLNSRGLRDAPAMGQWLRDKGHLPDQVHDAARVAPLVVVPGDDLHEPLAQNAR